MSKFKVGDTVRYLGGLNDAFIPVGAFGSVTDMNRENIWANWNAETSAGPGVWVAANNEVELVTSFSSTFDVVVGGVKHDQDKIDVGLVPIGPMLEVARVWTFGKKKYSAWNWTKGFTFSRPYAAALRHIYAWASGQDKDPETGLSHLAHAICCLQMLIEYQEQGTGQDDRYKTYKQENTK